MKRAIAILIILLWVTFASAQGVVTVKRISSSAPASSLLTNLAGSWTFDESSGDAADSSGNGTTLTNNNTATFNTGLINNAGYFVTASSQYFSAANNANITLGDIDFTIAFWVYIPTASASSFLSPVSKRSNSAGLGAFTFVYAGTIDNTIRFNVIKPGDIDVTVTEDTVPTPDAWHLVIAWHDATANEIGISLDDGTPITQATGGALQTDGSPFTVGQTGLSGNEFYFGGRIDNVNMWKKVLTSTERTCFYNAAAGTQYPFTGLCE